MDPVAPKKRGRPPGAKAKNKIIEGLEEAVAHATATTAAPKSILEKAKARFQYIDDEDDDRLKIPMDLIPDGMEYQWVTNSVRGQDMGARRAQFERKGWEAVPASRHPGMWTPKSFQGEIVYYDCVLMERPKEYSDRFREKDRQRARDQVRIKEAQLRGGDIEGVSLDTQHQTALRQNKVSKSYERVDIPED